MISPNKKAVVREKSMTDMIDTQIKGIEQSQEKRKYPEKRKSEEEVKPKVELPPMKDDPNSSY